MLGYWDTAAMTYDDAMQSAVAEWMRAEGWSDQIDAWRKANPDEQWGPPREWERQHGIPDILSAGRLHCQSRRDGTGWWTMKLAEPTEHGSHAILCRQCRQLGLVNHPLTGAGLCRACRIGQLAERKTSQAKRRIERRRQRSAVLANRKGRCLVCGAEMTVARVTKTTCSDRCRKQWIRKGAEAFPLPETATSCKMPDGTVVPVAEVAPKLWSRYINERMLVATAKLGGTAPEDLQAAEERAALLKSEAERFERLAHLADLREKAPAIFLWELPQQRQVQA